MAEKFTRFTAVAAPYDPVNVDTDQIIPARFLKAPREKGYGGFLFHDAREQAEFFLDHPVFAKAKILVGNANFGCGSSREGAAYAFHDAGFRSVIAPSFGDIFFNNCMKNGIVPARLDESTCSSLRQFLRQNPGAELTVDLQAGKVRTPIGEFAFSIPPFFREMLLEGVDEIGLTLSMLPQIEAFEKDYAAATPWLTPLS
jgi:3-isopropylmalate/(R)-2-methylmalate dehydratase small subunit